MIGTWQVCIEDTATGILMARVHRGMAFTKAGAISKCNKLNAKLNMVRWETVRAVPVKGRDCRHLTVWRVGLTNY